MEYQKIARLVNDNVQEMPDMVSKFTSKETGDDNYSENKEIRFKTSMLRSDLCDYSDAYIIVTTSIAVAISRDNANNINTYDRYFTLKNNAPFVSCITKINGQLVENAEDIDIAMPMYNLIEYSKNYRKTNGSLHNYYGDEPNSGADGDINKSIKNSASFDYKKKLTEIFADKNLNVNLRRPNVPIAIPLKHLGNFWRGLDMPLINCEIELILRWNKNCVLVNKTTREGRDAAGGQAAIVEVDTPTAATLTITDCKLYVPVVTLRSVDENKLLNSLRTGFKRTIKWNKYKSQITSRAVNNNLNYLIDPTFSKVHRLFVLAYENEDDRYSYSKYYTPTVEIKNYNVLIDRKPFFELLVKDLEETYQKIIDLGYNNDYTVVNLLDLNYFKKHYKLIAIDLRKSCYAANKLYWIT